MKESTVKNLKKSGLNPDEFTSESPQSLVDRIVVADPKTFGFSKDKVLFKVTGGFGANLSCRGTALFVKREFDGAEGRIERYDIVAVKKT